MSAPVGVLGTLKLPDEDAFTKLLAARVDRVSTELLDEIWGADFGDPPGSGTVRQLLTRLGKELKVTREDRSLGVRGVTTWELFAELGRTVAAIARVAHDAGGHGMLDFESETPARAARIDVGRWQVTEPEPNLLVRLSPAPVPRSDQSLLTAIEAVRLGTADDAALMALFDAVAPKSVDRGYFPHSQAVRLAVEALVASRDPRIEQLAVARIPKVIDAGHGAKAALTADLVRVLATRGTDTATRKIMSISGRARPPARRPAGPVHLACQAALGAKGR